MDRLDGNRNGNRNFIEKFILFNNKGLKPINTPNINLILNIIVKLYCLLNETS